MRRSRAGKGVGDHFNSCYPIPWGRHVVQQPDVVAKGRKRSPTLFPVTEAASGRAGVALGSDDTRHFDLALCDVILGDISGPALDSRPLYVGLHG